MDKKSKVVLSVLILVLVLLAAVSIYFSLSDQFAVSSGYSVVYAKTGEIYIGKLSLFPKMQLTDAYLFQTVKDAQDSAKISSQLQSLRDADWAPKTIYLVRENIIFYGPLEDTSKIAEALKRN